MSTREAFTSQSRLLTNLYEKPFENMVGKGENAANQHFLLFHHVFYPFFNQLPNDNILDWSKLKQIADDILKCI